MVSVTCVRTYWLRVAVLFCGIDGIIIWAILIGVVCVWKETLARPPSPSHNKARHCRLLATNERICFISDGARRWQAASEQYQAVARPRAIARTAAFATVSAAAIYIFGPVNNMFILMKKCCVTSLRRAACCSARLTDPCPGPRWPMSVC